MDTITLINLARVLLDAATRDPRWDAPLRRSERTSANKALFAAGRDTLGVKPTVSALWYAAVDAQEATDAVDAEIALISATEAVKGIIARASLRVEEVAHAPVLNAQAQRVARGEVARDFRGRILPAETAAIFA